MTTVRRISLSEMMDETGIPALGYARPQRDEITLVDGMPSELEKHVMAHEAEHIAKGEEGPFIGSLLGGIAGGLGSIFAGKQARRGAENAAATQRAMLERLIQLNQPMTEMRDNSAALLSALFGLPMPTVAGSVGNTIEDTMGGPTAGALTGSQMANPLGGLSVSDFLLNMPGNEFILQQGQNAVESSAAASGGLFSGAAMRALNDRARADSSGMFNNTVSQLLGMMSGSMPATQQIGAGMMNAGTNIGNAQMQAGNASAAGIMGFGNSIADMLHGIGSGGGFSNSGGTGGLGAGGGAFNPMSMASMMFGGFA